MRFQNKLHSYITLCMHHCRSVNDKKMAEFFKNDFKEDRWRRAALKNAFALMARQRFQHAAAFFLLAGAVRDAVEVRVTVAVQIYIAHCFVSVSESPMLLCFDEVHIYSFTEHCEPV